jgi:hypothetical protein
MADDLPLMRWCDIEMVVLLFAVITWNMERLGAGDLTRGKRAMIGDDQ